MFNREVWNRFLGGSGGVTGTAYVRAFTNKLCALLVKDAANYEEAGDTDDGWRAIRNRNSGFVVVFKQFAARTEGCNLHVGAGGIVDDPLDPDNGKLITELWGPYPLLPNSTTPNISWVDMTVHTFDHGFVVAVADLNQSTDTYRYAAYVGVLELDPEDPADTYPLIAFSSNMRGGVVSGTTYCGNSSYNGVSSRAGGTNYGIMGLTKAGAQTSLRKRHIVPIEVLSADADYDIDEQNLLVAPIYATDPSGLFRGQVQDVLCVAGIAEQSHYDITVGGVSYRCYRQRRWTSVDGQDNGLFRMGDFTCPLLLAVRK